jgi:YD repeat-containing protein
MGRRFFAILLIIAVLSLGSEASALTITYSYDADGQLTNAVYSSGESITYTYDAAGNILTRTVAGGITQTYALTVSKSGSGGGTVASSPAGIDCGVTCSASFNAGTTITLTATPDTGSSFTGWQGACSGAGACSFAMDGEKAVTAAFTLNPVNGACGSANGQSFTTAPAADLCAAGAATALSGTGPWSWSCTGANGGTTSSCSANLQATAINGVCGSANGQTFSTAPTTGLCSAGTATEVTYSVTMWSWSCVGTDGGSTIACMANAQTTPINGVCGSANGQIFTSAPSENLCSAGTATAVSGNNPWTWNCAGANGGVTVNCSTSGQTPSGVKGDVDNDKAVTLADAIAALQVLSGFTPAPLNVAAAINNSGRIGLTEAVYALQKVAGLREAVVDPGVVTGTNLSLVSQGMPASGFIFSTGQMVTGPTMGDFMINAFVSPGTASGILTQGTMLQDLGTIGNIANVTEAPATGYATPQPMQLTAGHAYAFQLSGGKYGIIVVKSVTSSPTTMVFDYKYQPSGARTF